MKLRYRKGIFLVVYRKENSEIKYLILKRKLHWKGWEFPKGGIEAGESISKAIKRELKEETGARPKKIINLNFKGKFDYPRELKDRPGIKGMIYFLFAVEIAVSKKNKIKLDKKEHSSYKWLSFKEAYKKLSFNDKKKCLKTVDKLLGKKERQGKKEKIKKYTFLTYM